MKESKKEIERGDHTLSASEQTSVSSASEERSA
nr:MAG TPA: hypothetical protein [Caudoviricetes sp.]